jgi:hypothetical protein
MIKFSNLVPTVYTSASRDFQYLSWLINIVLNSVKHNVDDLYNLPNNKTDPRLVELLAMTLGFKVRRNYDQEQLASIVEIIPSILRNKGNLSAITIVGNALIKASGATGTFECKYEDIQDCCLEIRLPKDLIDMTLFLDLLPYILPAGMSCKITRKSEKSTNIITEVGYNDTLVAEWHEDLRWTDGNKTETTGLSHMFNTDGNDINFALGLNENIGLLDNSIIPVLNNSGIQTTDQTYEQTEENSGEEISDE